MNEKQQEVINAIGGPVLVLAGPGTGKTQLISACVEHILQTTDTPAETILCLTFTDNGATNMRNRLTSLIKEAAYQVEINTYHGFSQTIINQNREYFLEQNLDNVIDFITQNNFISEIQAKLPQNNILKNARISDVISTINDLKQSLISPSDLLAVADENKLQIDQLNRKLSSILADFKAMPRSYDKAVGYFEQMRTAIKQIAIKDSFLKKFPPLLQIALTEIDEALTEAGATDKGSTKPLTAWKNKFLEKNDNGEFVFKDNFNDIRLRTLQKIYDEYSQKMTEAGLYDFSDMIIKTIETIEKNPALKYNLQEKYLYILLDEYQDTNRAQSRLIELLTDNPVNEGRPNIMAVGDDDQAIYAFQGALFSNMLDFYNSYRGTTLINLTENYRSHADIIATATKISGQIEDRIATRLKDVVSKELVASNKSITDCEIERIDYPNQLAEYAGVAEKIKELQEAGDDLNEVAVLAPKHKYLEGLTPYLSKLNIPIRYEKSENVLENQGIKLLLAIAKLVSAIANRQYHNDLLFEVLSYPIWKLDTPLLWKLSWQADNNKSWLEFIIESDDFVELKPIVYWLMEFAKITDQISLEANFDYLIGNSELTYKIDGTETAYKSPIREFYENSSPKKLVDFILDVNLLRSNYLNYGLIHKQTKDQPLKQLVELTDAYINAGEKMGRTNSYTESSQAVNLMTAFGAKGLEFTHVFLLETNDNTWGGSRSNSNKISLPVNLQPIRHDRETFDEKARLLFVAITRAKTNLYLMNSLANLNNKPNKRLRFFQEIAMDNGWKTNILPEKFAENKAVAIEVNESQLSNNLFDNYSDWRERHLKDRLEYADILTPKLERYKLSATGFNSYTDLVYNGPRAYFFSRILGFPSSYNIRTHYGTTVHYVLDRLQNSEQPISSNLAIDLFRKKLESLNLTEADFNELMERATISLPSFIEAREEIFQNKDISVQTEESYYSRHVVIGEARVNGTIDRLEIDKKNKAVTIVDFKTGKSIPTLDKSNSSLYQNLKQLYFYRLMLIASKRFEGYKINQWRLEFVDPDKTGKINYLSGEFDEGESQRIYDLIQVIWQKTMTLDFTEPEFSSGQRPGLTQIKQFEKYLLENDAQQA